MLSEGRREGLRLSLNRSLSEPYHDPPAPPSSYTPTLPPLPPLTTPDYDSSGAPLLPGSLTLPLRPHTSVSMPASPCSSSGETIVSTTRTLSIMRKVRLIEPAEVARRITRTHKPRPYVILDLRPFFHFNLRHVRSAVNLNCSDRFNRKRLLLRRASVVDLASSPSRDSLRRRGYKDVIVYDDSTTDLSALPPDHPVLLVLSAIIDEQREPLLMKGKTEQSFLLL